MKLKSFILNEMSKRMTNTVLYHFVESKKIKFIEIKSKMVVTRNWGSGVGNWGDVDQRYKLPVRSKFWGSNAQYCDYS